MSLLKLGKTNIELTKIGLGCWQFSKNKGLAGSFWPKLTDEVTNSIVEISVNLGINWFDTAELYGWGKSEIGISEALNKLDVDKKNNFIATKWWPLFRCSGSIIKTIDKRISCLGGFPITLHQVHMPFGLSSIESEMNAMADLVEQGKIKHIGVSNFNQKQMIRAHAALQKRGLDLASNQMEYSILNRDIEFNGVLEKAKELGISIIAYSPLAQGFATGKFHINPEKIKNNHRLRNAKLKRQKLTINNTKEVIDELNKIADIHNSTPSQIALSWLVNYNSNVFAIPGATNSTQAMDNAKALKINLSKEEIRILDSVSKKIRNA